MIEIILKLLMLAVIGSLIGWMTNRLAIKMLFKPAEPKKILFFELHGLLPRRQKELAKSVGEIVSEEFISISELIDKLVSAHDIDEMKDNIKEKIVDAVNNKVPPMIKSLAGGQIQKIIDTFINDDGEKMLLDFLNNIENKAKNSIDINKMVEDKINELNFSEFEDIVMRIAKKELRHIEYIGAILGFLIGVIQGVIVIFI